MNSFIKKTKKYWLSVLMLALFLPTVSSAAASQTVSDLILKISDYVQQGTIFIVTLCIFLFSWGLFLIYFKKTDVDHTKGVKFIIGAVIALASILSLWALVAILRASLGIDGSNNVDSGEIRGLIPF